MALSMDLRLRFAGLMDKGLSAAAAGRRLAVEKATAARWGRRYREEGTVEAKRVGAPKGRGKLEDKWPFFQELLEQDSDITLMELRDAFIEAFGISCTTSGINDLRKRHGYTYKKRAHRAGTRQTSRQAGKARMGRSPGGDAPASRAPCVP